ncbi:hypothetical protein G718_00939 [Escherichia coli HVH 43 (4-2173468)]|nr:hypothetical protein A139_02888 [Escherichia coli KTE181]EQO68506.1 hypothetical protein G718_00939 [Escherichia coli HVH 43 (4-2173468)]ESP15126.1 hypothetical protein G794_03115 [Escherichia coli HVH 136 (4-5970458)]
MNALSDLQDRANSIYCRKHVGLISVAHQAVLPLPSVSRAAKAALQIIGKVRVVHVGCGVNALSDLQDRANSIYCRKHVGLISVAHQAVLPLPSVSRAAKAALQIIGKVRVVHVGCGVNALSDLQDRENSIYCRKYVGLISVAHQAVLPLPSVSRAAKAALFLLSRDKRNCTAGDHGIGQFTVPTLCSGKGYKSGIIPQSFTAQADCFCFSRTF